MSITTTSERAGSERPREIVPPSVEAGPELQSAAEPPPRELWRSEELLAGRAEVKIAHNGQVYRLRCTRQGKLILYK